MRRGEVGRRRFGRVEEFSISVGHGPFRAIEAGGPGRPL